MNARRPSVCFAPTGVFFDHLNERVDRTLGLVVILDDLRLSGEVVGSKERSMMLRRQKNYGLFLLGHIRDQRHVGVEAEFARVDRTFF